MQVRWGIVLLETVIGDTARRGALSIASASPEQHDAIRLRADFHE
jgi:hypothetical protein